MRNYISITLLFALFTISLSFGQEEEQDLQLTSKDSIVVSSSILGLGFNFVDDSGDVFDELLSVGTQWNYVPYPSRINIGRNTKMGLVFEAIGTFNKYQVGNVIDGVVNTKVKNYFAIDSRISYDLNKLIGQTGWFDPYVGVGLGYTSANEQPRGTYNASVGFRTWLSDRWGLDFSSSGKWAMGNNGATNHIQHAVGAVYQFDIEKGLSKKGEEKLALINEIEKEKQRVNDSIATVNRLKEEALLAERLAQEKEKARLAALEKAKIDAEHARKQQIIDEINALGKVQFALNSSFLTKEAKTIAIGLTEILKKNSELTLQITAHTDARGTDKYNLWLSERRADRIVDYLVTLGIELPRLTSVGMGETQLLNHCDDNVSCTEKEHFVNRRSDFKVISF
ncbi:OmpA family protein [Aurantibacter crassamenti]|uniref:OmpA family protein n=1 Tax=Aurantibacter crassamenti TaxID=1837375 RepID=UPI001939B29A|nr:OmpA family protein [Aurantibacter crassamenti]MBM1106749.1 OmpA family protein [Aurantibacter crassamenti]